MLYESYHAFNSRTAFRAACAAAGWPMDTDNTPITPAGVSIAEIGMIYETPTIDTEGRPVEPDILDPRYHVNVAWDNVEMPASFVAAREIVKTPRRTFGLPQEPVVDEPVPDEVEAWKAKYILAREGLIDEVSALVTDESSLVYYAWHGATSWSRISPFIVQLADVLKLTEARIDELFREAARVKV